jgi:lipid II:glycine glycyltransferase (peptidoglycan interpeptide bridge formation enzyme)
MSMSSPDLSGATREPRALSVEVSAALEDPEWDRFLEETSGNHHLQSAKWAKLKSASGWEVLRLRIRQGGTIVGGVQILFRRLPLLGRFGYAPRGPVFRSFDTRQRGKLFAELDRVVKAERFLYLMIQPPEGDEQSVELLRSRGFNPSPLEVAPGATLMIDLNLSPQALLHGMRSGTKRAILKSLERGPEIRRGGESDLAAFQSLLVATGLRRSFTPPPLEYFQRLWKLFAPGGHIVLFLAELHGEPVAAELDIAYGDTLVSKRAGWSGQHRDLHLPTRLIWEAILWAKENGYKYYDLEGLDPTLARAIRAGDSPDRVSPRSQDAFKLGFGGRVTVLPENHEYVYGKVSGWMHRQIWLQFPPDSVWRRKLKAAF